MPTKCFFLTVTDQIDRRLRRYSSADNVKCPINGSYHNADVPFDVVPENTPDYQERISRDDQRWPKQCACGYVFLPGDNWQMFCEHLYKRVDNGEVMTLRAAPPGAMWDAEWWHDRPEYCGADGRSLVVKCPNGREWMIDGRANNCTLPNDKVHKCWVRHGDPPVITVDKAGVTCAAGAGSIQAGDYHGFLRNGEFTDG